MSSASNRDSNVHNTLVAALIKSSLIYTPKRYVGLLVDTKITS